MSARSTIVAEFERLAAERERKLALLSDDLKLLDSGLDSLSFALIVIRLEEILGVDPFDGRRGHISRDVRRLCDSLRKPPAEPYARVESAQTDARSFWIRHCSSRFACRPPHRRPPRSTRFPQQAR